MDIKKFNQKYNKSLKSSKEIFKKWNIEREVDDFLGTSVFTGVMIIDLLTGDGLKDRLSPDVYDAFQKLMGEKANTFEEIRELIVEKSLNGEASIGGLLNKIQGQLGENAFLENIGSSAKLASDGAQEGWDVSIDHGDSTQYIQVKIYKNPNEVIEKIREVNSKLEINGKGIAGIDGGNVNQIDFAVNSDIVEEVRERAKELGLENKILDVGASRDDLRGLLESNFEKLEDFSELNNFFTEILGTIGTVTVIHGVINAFFVWKGAKDINKALEDTAYSSAISTGGVAAAFIAEDLLWLAGPMAGVMGIGVGVGVRSVLKRITQRRFLAEQLDNSNKELQQLIENFK